MNILFLSDNFPPETNAPATRLYEHAVRWVRSGHGVTVVTCAPNFPEGRLFPGYKNKWYQVTNVDGIRVVRVKTYITANEGFLKRTLDYISFMFTGVVAGLFQKKPDVIVGTSPQFFCALGAWALSAIRRKPFVFELRDLWPASIVAVGAMKKSLIIRSLEKLELFLYRRATVIIPVTRAFKKDLVDRGIDADKVHVVRNGVDLQTYQPIPKDEKLDKELRLKGKFVVGYLGTHGMAHGLDKVVEAIDLLKERGDIVFVFAGGGAARAQVEDLVHIKGLRNVRLLPRQPKSAMPSLWSICDVSLIPLKDNPVFSTVIPSKLFEAMGMGVPVIMSLPPGEATQIVESTETGLTVEPENPVQIANAIKKLAGDGDLMSRLRSNAIKSVDRYSRDELAARMLAVMKACVS